MREPTRRPPVGLSGWNDQAAVALLVLVAGHLLATEPTSSAGPLTPDRLARVGGSHDLPALVAVCEGSPSEQARHGAHQLRHLIRAGQASVGWDNEGFVKQPLMAVWSLGTTKLAAQLH